jgi:predicted AAA+ superfamily ATPase
MVNTVISICYIILYFGLLTFLFNRNNIDFMEAHILRHQTEADINEFLTEPNSGLVFLRGRRRVGKSSLLKKISQTNKNCFYFSGALDEPSNRLLTRFARAWDEFAKTDDFARISSSQLDWEFIFQKIVKYSHQSNRTLILMLDEIQWLAQSGTGFVGLLKNAWVDFEKTHKMKLILCGSSNKFFVDNVGGEEKILRGMITRSDIWLYPLSPVEVKKFYGKSLSPDENIFLYMLTGGIPYYLNQFHFQLGFIRGINDAVFCERTIFLSEADEVLNIDFKNRGLPTIKSIFQSFKSRYATIETIKKNTRIAASTLTEAVHKLQSYSLLFELIDFSEKVKIKKRNTFFYYKDFFLFFYFKVLQNIKNKSKKIRIKIFFPLCCRPTNHFSWINSREWLLKTLCNIVSKLCRYRILFLTSFL